MIIVNGENHDVTINLACAMRHLRSSEEILTIWIDALCIDQSNISEKNRQVAMMRDIYARAEEVVVFLGDGVHYRIPKTYPTKPLPPRVVFWNDSRDQRHLNRFYDSGGSGLKQESWHAFNVICLICIHSQLGNRDSYTDKVVGATAERRHQYFELLRRFTVEPWWQRIWVVQEVAISRKISICYGNVTAPWEMFVQAAQPAVLEYYCETCEIDPQYSKVLSLFNTRISDIESLRVEWHVNESTDLLSLIHRFSDRKATNELDKVYALLGLSTQKHLVPTNYSLPISELYERTAIALIKSHGNLAALSGNRTRKDSQKLTSWAPDWSAILERPDRERMVLYPVYNACSTWRVTVFKTAGQYWEYVAEQMELLAHHLQSSSLPPRKLSMQLQRALASYRKCLENHKIPLEYRHPVNRIRQSCAAMLGRTPECRNDDPAPPIADTVAETEELFTFSAIFRGLPSKPKSNSFFSCDTFSLDTVSLFSVDTLRDLTPYAMATSWTHIEESGLVHTVLDRMKFDNRNRLLETESKSAASVRWCGTRLATWVDEDSGSFVVSEWMRRALLGNNDPKLGRIRRFARTLVGGIHWEATEPRRLSPADYGSLLYWFRCDLLKRVHSGCFGENISSIVGDALQLDGVNVARDYYREMRLATEGRVFFETMDGRFGLGPGSMAPGDELHVLPGGKTHFVLRHRSKSLFEYELIGDCFLDSEQDYYSEPRKEEATMKGSLPWELLGLMCLQNGCPGDGRGKIVL
ncbi:heterokaryon incompatibility protein-domain-containing protein, partial [Xylaria sp. FL0043]